MTPTPQSALPLPPHPSLERYRKLAKELVKVCQSGNDDAFLDWAQRWLKALAERTSGLPGGTPGTLAPGELAEFARRTLRAEGARPCVLASAQFVVARAHGFESWPKFMKHLEGLLREGSSISRFEAAADAIVTGDMNQLQKLLGEDAGLSRARSTREHRATLLHYVAANGVESYRQVVPKNALAILDVLLEAGAEVDATAQVYGDDLTTLELAATSAPPEHAGVQQALLETLLDRGAQLDRPSKIARRPSLVFSCYANGRQQAAEFLARRGARLDLAAAAALGRLDLVQAFFDPQGALGHPPPSQLQQAFLYACEYGRTDVAAFLLARGAKPATQGGGGQTALHHAVIGGQLAIVELLLRHQAPLEVANSYGGTVLGQALWSAAHGAPPATSIAILEALTAAGARLPARHLPVNARVDAWLEARGSVLEPRRKRSRAEPSADS